MRISIDLLRKNFLFLLIPCLIGITYLGSTVLSSSTKRDNTVVKINNLTHSCALLNVKKHKDHIQVSIQNNSDKAITAFVITSRMDPRTVFTFKEEFAFSEGDLVIAPGQSYDKLITIPSSLNRQNEIDLILSAVIFDDNNSEGDPNIIRDIEDNRSGQKIQLMKAFSVIERLSRLSNIEMGIYWNKDARNDLEAALNAPDTELLIKLNKKHLNNSEPYHESEQFQLGVQAGKESVFYKFQELKDIQEKQGTSALRERVIGLRDLYTKMIAKF